MFHLTPLEQICPLNNFEVGFWTPSYKVMMGSEDTLKIVFKGKMKYVQKRSSLKYFDHGQFQILI